SFMLSCSGHPRALPSFPTRRSSDLSRAMHQEMSQYLMVILWSQKMTLTLGGAIFCWRAVRRERELNTFDFQRITRLTPLDLAVRSEEHTSELQSLAYLVCRLLLEKK